MPHLQITVENGNSGIHRQNLNTETSFMGKLQFCMDVCDASPSAKQMDEEKGRQLCAFINATRYAGAIRYHIKFDGS